MPLIVLFIIIIVALIGFGCYQMGFGKGHEAGKIEESRRYKEEINVETKQVVVD